MHSDATHRFCRCRLNQRDRAPPPNHRVGAIIQRVSEMTGLDLPEATALLRGSHWDADTATVRWLDAVGEGKEAAMRTTMGMPAKAVEDDADAGAAAGGTEDSGMDDEYECPSCWNDVPCTDGHAMPCGHRFCGECWTDFVNNAIATRRAQCVFTECPQDGCNEMLTSRVVAKFATPDNAKAYGRAVVERCVLEAPFVKVCKGDGCDRLVEYSGGQRTIECVCGKRWCFACGRDPHRPATCEVVDVWDSKVDEFGGKRQGEDWIALNTRQCPNVGCRKRLFRYDGCNHMVSRVPLPLSRFLFVSCVVCVWLRVWCVAWSLNAAASGGRPCSVVSDALARLC